MDLVYKKVKNLLEKKIDKKYSIKVWSRKSLIFKEYVGIKFQVYQGRKFINVIISDEMVGHKFGEFSPTRIRHEYKKKKIKGKK